MRVYISYSHYVRHKKNKQVSHLAFGPFNFQPTCTNLPLHFSLFFFFEENISLFYLYITNKFVNLENHSHMKMQSLSSASFNSYSPSDNLSRIAARVINEFHSRDDLLLEYSDESKIFVDDDDDNNNNQQQRDEDEDEDEFEFPRAPVSPIPADEIISNGRILPVYPLFNTELVFGKNIPNTNSVPNNNSVTTSNIPKAPSRAPLGKLFKEEHEKCASSSSCSSSESDELNGVPTEIYCVWKPNTGDNPGELRKKSSSTGTSNRWKFRHLLRKSNSDGNDTFDFLNTNKEVQVAGKQRGPVKENHVRRSFLPDKKDLVELFFSVNGVSRHVNPY